MQTKILFLITGSINKIIESNNLNYDVKIVKINDKILAKPKEIFRNIDKNITEVYFGTIDNNFQRFIFFMSLYTFIKGVKGFLIDQKGNKIEFSRSNLLFKRLPLFITEILASLFCIIFYYPIYYYYKWKFKKI